MSEEKIIELPKPEEQQQPPPAPLSLEKATRFAIAIRRLRVLKSQKIATSERDAEIRGINAMLINELPHYADELVGCWLAIHREYEPLIEAVANILRRASEATQRHMPAKEESKQG